MSKVNLAQLKPMITIITDASHCPRTKRGGWATWIVCDNKRLRYSDELKKSYVNSNFAEMAAIINGLQLAVDHFKPSKGTRILIQSDCQDALCKLGISNGGEYDIFAAKYLTIIADKGWQIDTRHVKGHQSSKKGARFYANNWVDHKAREHMRNARKKGL